MDNKNFVDQVLDERKFLHDISNKLLIAQGMSSFISRSLNKNESITPKDLERCEKLLKSVSAMTEMIKSRREHLHSLSD